MAYIYKKTIGNKDYYYLRASVRKGSRVIKKDIAYLGNNLEKIKEKLPSKYSKEIRKTYKTINRFLEVNHYLEEIKTAKTKTNRYLSKELLENVEACRLHWAKKFQRYDETTKEEILNNFLVEFAFNTTSIEGNTITLKQTQKLLIDNLTPKNKTLREIYDLKNTQKVFFNLLNSSNKQISHKFIQHIHSELMNDIDKRIGYRKEDVRVFKMNFKSTPAPYVLTDMRILLKWYNNNQDMHPLVLAIIFHHKFEKIHPFMDGNGRVGRMLMNYILINKGHPPLIIQKKHRLEYLNKLNKADKTDLNKADPKNYKELVEFVAKETIENYWNIFL